MQEQIFITEIEFLDLEEKEGGYVLTFKRKYSNGAVDNNSSSPLIKTEEFPAFLEKTIEEMKSILSDIEESFNEKQKEFLRQKEHYQNEISKLESFKQ